MTLDVYSPPDADSPERSSSSFVGNFLVIVGSLIALLMVLLIGAIGIAAVISSDDAADQVTETQLNVTLTEFAIDGELTAPAGRVLLAISNEGSLDHNVAVRGTNMRSQMLGAGGSTVLDLGELAPGTYVLKAGLYEPGKADTPLLPMGQGDPRVNIGLLEVYK